MKTTRKNDTRGEELQQRSMFTKQPVENAPGNALDWRARLEKKKNVAQFINHLFRPEWHLTHEAFYSTARMSNRTFARIIDSDNTREIPTEYTYCRMAVTVLCLFPDLCAHLAKQRLLDRGAVPHGVARLSVGQETQLRTEFIAAFGHYGQYLANNVNQYEKLQELLYVLYRKVDTRNRNKQETHQP